MPCGTYYLIISAEHEILDSILPAEEEAAIRDNVYLDLVQTTNCDDIGLYFPPLGNWLTIVPFLFLWTLTS